jgi:hypothetical protein
LYISLGGRETSGAPHAGGGLSGIAALRAGRLASIAFSLAMAFGDVVGSNLYNIVGFGGRPRASGHFRNRVGWNGESACTSGGRRQAACAPPVRT